MKFKRKRTKFPSLLLFSKSPNPISHSPRFTTKDDQIRGDGVGEPTKSEEILVPKRLRDRKTPRQGQIRQSLSCPRSKGKRRIPNPKSHTFFPFLVFLKFRNL